MEESACVTTRRRSMRGSHKATSNKDSDSDSESNSNNNNSNDGGSRENSNIYEDAINRVILGDMSTPGKKRLPLLSKSSLNKETNDTIFSSGGGNGGNKILSRRAFAGEIFEAEEAGAARTNLMLDSAMSADAKDELFNALDNKFRAENRKKAGIAAADNMDLLDAAHGGGSSSDGSKSSSGSEYESAEEELHPLRSSSLMDGTALMSGKDMFSFRSSKHSSTVLKMVLKSAGGSPATSYSANNDSLFKALAKKEYDSRKLASTPVKTTPTKSAQLRRAATMQVDEEKNEEGEGQENQEAKGGSTGSRRKSTSSVYTYSKSSVDSTPSKLSSRLVGPVKEDADVQDDTPKSGRSTRSSSRLKCNHQDEEPKLGASSNTTTPRSSRSSSRGVITAAQPTEHLQLQSASRRSSRNATPLGKTRVEILSGRSTPRVIVTKPTTNNKTVTTTPPASAATRRSKRLESKTTIDAKKTLGTPHLEKLVKKKRVEKALASVQIKEDSDESSSSSESEDEDDDEEEEEDEDQEKQRIQTEKFVIGDQTNDVGQGNGARNEDADMDEGEGDDEEAIIEAGASGRGVVGGRTYFSAFNSGNKRNETSDNTLSKLPPLTHDQYVKEMGSLTEKHASDLRLLCSLHLKSFPQYLFELHNDFNLLFYGFGSKMELLTRFAKDYLLTQARDGPVVVVNGFSPALTIKAVLNDIIRNVLLRVGPIGSLIDQVETIRKHFSKYPAHNQTLMKRLSVTKKPIVQESSQGGREDEVMDDCGDGIGVVNQRKEKEEEEKDEEDEVDDDSNLPKRLYILVHNIDGQSLRADKCQHLLASLARIPNVHLIASVDHINSPFLWNNALSTSFNWAWHDMTNFSGYTSETAFETSLLARLTSDNSGGGGAGVVGLMSHTSLGGVMFVLRSLPMNGRRLFKELVDYQMSEMKEKRLSMAAAAAAATAEAQRLQEEHDKEEEEDMAREMEKDGENEDESENNNRKRCLPRRAASMRSRKRAPVVAVSIPAIKRINPSECSISSRDLFRRCQERFIAQSDPQFRSMLVELIDHKLVLKKEGEYGDEELYVPYSDDILEGIVEGLN